jgi:hypothetical protein
MSTDDLTENTKLKADRKKLAYVDVDGEKRDSDAWCTPKVYLDASREVLGSIELDPYSSEYANKTVCADRFFSIENPAEDKEWSAKTVFMNPPYAAKLIKKAVEKFSEEYKKCNFAGIVLTNNSTETRWFQCLAKYAKCICFTNHRISFDTHDEKFISNNTRGQAFFYFGDNVDKFKNVFSKFGFIVMCDNAHDKKGILIKSETDDWI